MNNTENSLLMNAFHLHKQGNLEKAIQVYTSILDDDPDNFDALHLRSVAMRRTGHLADAIRGILRAIMIRPDIQVAVENLNSMLADAQIIIKSSSNKDSCDVLEACYNVVFANSISKDFKPDDRIFFWMSCALAKRGLWKEACQVARQSFLVLGENSPIPFLTSIALVDLVVLDDKLIKLSAQYAVKRLRKNCDSPEAISCFLFYAYWKDKPKSLDYFISSALNKLGNDVFASEMTLRFWYLCRTSARFFSNNVLNANEEILIREYKYATALEKRAVILISCDDIYWKKFSQKFTLEIIQGLRTDFVHINITDASNETKEEILKIANANSRIGYSFVSISDQNFAGNNKESSSQFKRTFYACCRFLIVPDLLSVYQCPIIVLDGDQVLKGSIEEFVDLFLAFATGDVAVNSGTRMGPTRELVCDVSGFRPTVAGRFFSRMLKKYILHFLRREKVLWMLDQAGFYSVYSFLKQMDMEPKITLLNREGVDAKNFFLHADGNKKDKTEVLEEFRSLITDPPN